ncbi:MAG TPA: choice-of-anchor Q domain-containing protein [Pyrinomonadaceae bacterium]|jgi:CSLREA domain-containing protein|nr:choice-of-anchor Q domain-containing protein [Pyrinomonadaceae bacterium]
MITTTRLPAILLIAFCFTISVPSVFGATFVVNTTSDTADVTPGNGTCADAGANCSLRAAISEANASAGDDIITLPAGTYTQSLVAAIEDNNAGGDWDIRQNLTINGAGAATTIIQAAATPGTATERVLHDVGGSGIPFLTLNDVTVRHGNQIGAASTDRGGGIASIGVLTVNNSVITLNSASGGGGINADGQVVLTGVTVSANSCTSSGTSCNGGGLRKNSGFSDIATITNSQFLNNTSTASGTDATAFGAGASFTNAFTVTISGTTFSGNQGTGTGAGGSQGSGIYFQTGSGSAAITNSSFTGNSGSGGSNIKGTAIAGSSTGAAGIFSGTWTGLTIEGNTGGSAVAFENQGAGTNVSIIKSTISGNTGAAEGGGVLINTPVSLIATTVSFTNTTISGNTASSSGGGVYVKHTASSGSTVVNFNYCTVAGNTATSVAGGGIFQTSGTVNLKNSVVADNTGTTGPDISGTVNSQDYNHIEDLTGATITGTTTHNATGAANLGTLQVNGSGPKTQLPGIGSPVIDTIPNGTSDCGTAVTTDERGVTRPQSGLCDKGAAEVEFPAGPWDLSGTVKTSDGRPIRNTAVTLSGGGLPAPVTVYTGMLGTYLFADLPGANYTVTVQGKKFTFASPSQMVSLVSDVTNADFIANEEIGVRPAPLVKDQEISVRPSPPGKVMKQ